MIGGIGGIGGKRNGFGPIGNFLKKSKLKVYYYSQIDYYSRSKCECSLSEMKKSFGIMGGKLFDAKDIGQILRPAYKHLNLHFRLLVSTKELKENFRKILEEDLKLGKIMRQRIKTETIEETIYDDYGNPPSKILKHIYSDEEVFGEHFENEHEEVKKIVDFVKLNNEGKEEVFSSCYFELPLIEILGEKTSSPFSSLRDFVIENFLPIFIPERNSSVIYTSDKPTIYIQEYQAKKFKLDEDLYPEPYQAVLAVPIKATPNDEKIRPVRGAIIIASQNPEIFNVASDIEFVHLLGVNMAMAMLNSGQYL